MAQIQSPETYADGQQVTAARLNNQTNGAILLPGAVTDQTALTANTVASGDTVLLHDASASALRKATAGDLLGSGLPVTTSGITGASGVDLAITPAAGQKVDVGGDIEVEDATLTGNLTVTGSSTLTGNVIADNGFTSNGTANFTGQLQVNGSTAYALYEVSNETITPWTSPTTGAFDSIWTSAAFVKPADEIWAFEFYVHCTMFTGNPVEFGLRYSTQSHRTGEYITSDFLYDWGNGSVNIDVIKTYRWTVGSGTALSSQSLKVDAFVWASAAIIFGGTAKGPSSQLLTTGTLSPSKFRIYKYKTA